MPQTKAGAAKNPWLMAQRECAAKYKESKAQTKAEGAKSKASPKAMTKAQKTKEVTKEVAHEKSKTRARAAASSKALKADDAKVKRAVRVTEAPARKAHAEKVKKHADDAKKAMVDESVARALRTVQERRQAASRGQPADTAARQCITGKTSAFLIPGY